MNCTKKTMTGIALLAGFAMLLTFIVVPSSASAQETIEAECMQDVAEFNLNCTANDVQISGVDGDIYGDL
jgi:hypothetical protein